MSVASTKRDPRRLRHLVPLLLLALIVLAGVIPSARAQSAATSASPTGDASTNASSASASASAAAPAAPAGSGAQSVQPARLAEAKDLFRRATALLQAGDPARALELYQQSRALVPSMHNTLNAAICLERLGRDDEALDMYADLVAAFSGDLTPASRESVLLAMSKLRRRLGAIEISSNVAGTVVVDGRDRGKLPLPGPLPAKPGRHLLRVLKDGYDAFETSVVVEVGVTAMLDARLRPLGSWGKLRVDDQALEGSDVLVDGARLGVVPWEGTLAPGPHLVVLRKGQTGAGPLLVQVIQGQTVPLSARLAQLGPEITISVDPLTAELRIDDVSVGKGMWRGRLTRGQHRVVATESGYVPATIVVLDSDARIALRADAAHPRWGKPGYFWLEGATAFGLARSLGSGAESWCEDRDCAGGVATGPWAALRAGYTFRFGGGLEVGGGYLWLRRDLSRTIEDSFRAEPRQSGEQAVTVPLLWNLDQQIRMSGPFILVGGHQQFKLGESLFLRARLDAALWFAQVRQGVTGTVSSQGETRAAEVERSAEPVRSNALVLLPEVDVGWSAGPWSVTVGLLVGAVLGGGGANPLGDARPTGGSCVANPSQPGYNRLSVDCAPGRSVVAGERSHGAMILWAPVITVRSSF